MQKQNVQIHYFRTVASASAEEVVQLYRRLAMQHHPDRGGDSALMAAINAEFEYVIEARLWEERKQHEARRQAESAAAGQEWRGQVVSREEMREISQAMFNAYIQVAHLDDLVFEVCGDWLWVTGATRTYKEQLKAAGFWWSSPKLAWFLQGTKPAGKGGWSLARIRERYGSRQVAEEPKPARLRV